MFISTLSFPSLSTSMPYKCSAGHVCPFINVYDKTYSCFTPSHVQCQLVTVFSVSWPPTSFGYWLSHTTLMSHFQATQVQCHDCSFQFNLFFHLSLSLSHSLTHSLTLLHGPFSIACYAQHYASSLRCCSLHASLYHLNSPQVECCPWLPRLLPLEGCCTLTNTFTACYYNYVYCSSVLISFKTVLFHVIK